MAGYVFGSHLSWRDFLQADEFLKEVRGAQRVTRSIFYFMAVMLAVSLTCTGCGKSGQLASHSTAPPEGEGANETVILPGNVPLEMVWIPAGSFMMGSPATEKDRAIDELQRKTELGGFWIGKYELTQAQWKAVMGTTSSCFQGDKKGGGNTDNRPVVQVSWFDAERYILALNRATGMTFRLPSEAEWEYACRAGTNTRFYWGDDKEYTQIETYAWYTGNCDGQTHDVGSKTPNAWGLYDMTGNAAEWCQDWYSNSYAMAMIRNPKGPTTGLGRVVRGGSFGSILKLCRSAARIEGTPAMTHAVVGFRLAR